MSASSGVILPRFGYSAKHIAASTTVSHGPGWKAIVEGTNEVSSGLRKGFCSHVKQ